MGLLAVFLMGVCVAPIGENSGPRRVGWFGYSGHLLWQLGAIMAVCQIGGSVIGTRLAMKHGSGFVRKLFLVVVSILIVKTGYDAWIR